MDFFVFHEQHLGRQLAGLFVFSFLSSLVLAEARKVSNGEDLGILIVGSIANTQPDQSVALVKETANGRVKAIKTGFKVLDDYLVSEVTAKYILLKKGANTILVYQNKFAAEFLSEDAGKSNVDGGFLSASDQYLEDGFERRGNKIKVSANLRDKLINEELAKVLMQATAVPKIENGEIVGFRILQIDAGSIYDKAGIRDNDVVTSINGIKLNSIAGAVRLLKSLRGAQDIELEINRNGILTKIDLSVGH